MAPLTQPSHRRALVPREHGAWAQMALPLVSALLVAGVSVSALLLAAATVLGFIAHEPALVLVGVRGVRVREAEGARARRWLVLLLVGAVTGGVVGLLLAPWSARAALLVAGAAGALLMGLAVRRREQSMVGEFIAVTAFVAAGAAVALSSGSTLALALTLTLTWWLAFGASIFAVHVVLARASSKGVQEHGVRNAMLVVALVVGGSLLGLHFGLGWVIPAALAPMAVLSLVVCLVPFSARDLHRLGWGLAGASTTTLVVLVLGLRFSA